MAGEDAQQRMEAGDFEGASALLRAAPPTPEGLLMRFGCELRCDQLAAALQTLDQLAAAAPQLAPAVGHFRGLARCELTRRARASSPEAAGQAATLGTPDAAMMELVRVRTLLVQSKDDEASAALEALKQAAPKQAGRAVLSRGEARAFTDLWDSDDATGPTLQVFVSDGAVLDLPFSNLRRVVFDQPRTSFDFLWKPVEFQTRDGGGGRAAVPAHYEGTGRHAMPEVRLGNLTLWDYRGKVAVARGQRDLKLFGEGGGAAMVGIHNIQELHFDGPAPARPAPPPAKPGFFKRLFGG